MKECISYKISNRIIAYEMVDANQKLYFLIYIQNLSIFEIHSKNKIWQIFG